MLNPEDSTMAANAICHAAEMTRESIRGTLHDIYIEHTKYSILMRPKLFIDGDQWCALYGADLQEGVAGFGDSPGRALADFDKNMCTVLATPADSKEGE